VHFFIISPLSFRAENNLDHHLKEFYKSTAIRMKREFYRSTSNISYLKFKVTRYNQDQPQSSSLWSLFMRNIIHCQKFDSHVCDQIVLSDSSHRFLIFDVSDDGPH
jgi:hypothetical protein